GAGNETGPLLLTNEVLKEKYSAYLWPSGEVESVCELGDWLQIRIDDGRGKGSFITGWVEKRFIARELSDDQKRGLFWDIEYNKEIATEDKDWVRKGALRALS